MTNPQAAAERPTLLEHARECGGMFRPGEYWRNEGLLNKAPATVELTESQLTTFVERIRQDQREKDVATCKAERVDAAATGDATDAAYNRAIDHCISAIGTPA